MKSKKVVPDLAGTRSAPSRSGREARAVLCALAVVLFAVVPARAALHLMVIQEVFVGPPGDALDPNLTPNQRAQYVMLRMTSSGQTLLAGSFLRVEDKNGNILGPFMTFRSSMANGGAICSYPACPAIIAGTNLARSLFTFNFDQTETLPVPAQPTRIALPRTGGRVCFMSGTQIFDCAAWGNFSCTAANCPGGPNALHPGESSGNLCDTNFGTPAAPAGLQYGSALARSVFVCGTKENSTDLSFKFPRPVNNAGNNNNTDADSDGLIDQLDCNDAAATLLWPPTEVTNQRMSGGTLSTDSWDSQSATSGSGIRYDEASGTLASLAGFTDDVCTFNNSAGSSVPSSAVPAAGTGLYFVVRADGGTGCTGTYGRGSGVLVRDPAVTSCSSP